MSGHVFVVNGDLTKLACDAILVPTDTTFNVEEPWRRLVEHYRPFFKWGAGDMLLLPREGKAPDVWLGNVGHSGSDSASIPFERAVRHFVQAALEHLNERPPEERIYPWPNLRLAVNLIGSGRGGAALTKGGLAEGLLKVLGQLARKSEVDLILVAYGEKPYAAVQRARQRCVDRDGLAATWSFDAAANPALANKADELAQGAVERQLVLFMGAGVSAGAGLPDWKSLLSEVAVSAGIERASAELLEKYDLRDQATVIETRLNGQERRLRDEVKNKLTEFSHYSLAHGLLASLPSNEAITTNFDELFETAAAHIDGRELAVLPTSPLGTDGRWLLKLHGTVDKPDGIVLTRSDFLNMPRQYGALMGLVQALLMMRHMLFVGYSLSDEDFHELVHEVRVARQGAPVSEKVGTVLTLFEDPIANELWSGDLDIVAMMSGKVDKVDMSIAARQLDIFLDLLGFLSTTSAAFFLDETYAELTKDEDTLRNLLSDLVTATAAAKPGTVAHSVQRFLKTLGA